MKGKLYLFGIGGTGSRVVKSLMMLAASGADVDASAIVPIIIDPDFANADLTRTLLQMKRYTSVRNHLGFTAETRNEFFKTEIKDVLDGYRFDLKDTRNKRFSEFIQYAGLTKENRALASMLFSDDNLDSDMEVGFKGNPNIGSVVLNQFSESDDFAKFANSFEAGDRIFIVSSIFGGTGASGFPLLLKNLRGIDRALPNFSLIQNAPIGAITVMPYFKVEPTEESSIDSSSFIGKTKAALHYYEKNVTGGQSEVNALYYIGDDKTGTYENNEGGNLQKNNAHLVEFASALSIVDFLSIPDDDDIMKCQPGANNLVFAPNPTLREFGIDNDKQELVFSDLSRKTREIVCVPMTRFVLFAKYLHDHLDGALSQTWAKDNEFDKSFLNSSFIPDLRQTADDYMTWLGEMRKNDRSFQPFKTDVSYEGLFDIVANFPPSKIIAIKAMGKNGYDLFDSFLNNMTSLPKVDKDKKFVELFYLVTKDLVDKKYNF